MPGRATQYPVIEPQPGDLGSLRAGTPEALLKIGNERLGRRLHSQVIFEHVHIGEWVVLAFHPRDSDALRGDTRDPEFEVEWGTRRGDHPETDHWCAVVPAERLFDAVHRSLLEPVHITGDMRSPESAM